MAKIGIERIIVHEDSTVSRDNRETVDFKYSIDVSTKGVFSTMLPEHIVNAFKEANIPIHKNRLNKEGYLSDITLDALKKQVLQLCQEFLSRELIRETLIIKYGIRTTAAYCLDENEGIVPNGRWVKNGEYQWKQGTENQNASSPHPFGLMVYAKPFKKMTYKYKSGNEKDELTPCNENSDDSENRPNLHWLSAICSMSHTGLSIQEIIYTEEVAAVFVNMIKSICAVNERVKDFISPEQILLVAQSNQKLLG